MKKSLKNRIITRLNFKDYYILSDKMYKFEKFISEELIQYIL